MQAPPGGAGADVFRFDANGGSDVISDFVPGSDKIVIGPSITNAILYNYRGSALLEFDNASNVLLSGVSPSAISATDLVFL
ncbi:hypothetical protein FV218_06960 [Methylobacterium sp. WL69]|uniref:hypothetical protein n=1 Tax=unclassified Methylobacterium TaxID=2615210 RepID=UPI0011C7C1C6|nr:MULTISPECIES: hypothetical protein [unclassified Methylobacterium]TXM76494.1 hypothetical protein FV218_06960 [Methylobacterium sp. WL69]